MSRILQKDRGTQEQTPRQTAVAAADLVETAEMADLAAVAVVDSVPGGTAGMHRQAPAVQGKTEDLPQAEEEPGRRLLLRLLIPAQAVAAS